MEMANCVNGELIAHDGVPKFELFDDRIEITSMGGLPFGFNSDDFFPGLSMPRNKELMRVFKDLELVEHLGSGIPRILETYDPSVFKISDNYLRVTFYANKPFAEPAVTAESTAKYNGSQAKTPVKTPVKILQILKENPEMSLAEVAQVIGKSLRAVERACARLTENGKLKYVGPKKGGRWQVTD